MKLQFILPYFSVLFLVLVSCKKDDTHTDKASIQISKSKPVETYSKNGAKVKAYDFKGLEYFLNKKDDKTYVINFWATWCVPCVEELPYFEKLNKEYKDDNVEVLLVSLDMAKMIESKLLPYVKKNKLKSDIIVLRDPDSNMWIPKIDKDWSGAIPATLIYNRNSRAFYEQSFTYKELEEALLAIHNNKK